MFFLFYNVHFLTGLAGNKSLNDLARITIDSAEKQFKSTGKPVKRYHSFDYAADSWSELQRVIVKVEVSEKGTNIRYVVTDIRCVRTKALYEQGYCARGKMELYIKESKTYLESDRMSCSRFEANHFRFYHIGFLQRYETGKLAYFAPEKWQGLLRIIHINELNEEEKGILLKLIETFVSKKRFKDYLQKNIAAL